MIPDRPVPSAARRRARFLADAALTAALYVALTWTSSLLGLASMPVQLRFSEALCVLTVLTPAAVPGLTAGCLLANLLTGSAAWDVVCGSLATLAGAIGGRVLALASARLRRSGRAGAARVLLFLVPFPTVLANTLVVPLILLYAYRLEGAFPLLAASVCAGETISAWAGGLLLLRCAAGRIPGRARRDPAARGKGPAEKDG